MRSKQFYVSTDVSEAYWAIAQADARDGGLCQQTPDEIADKVLRKFIDDNYPWLFKQLAARREGVSALDKQLIEQVTNGRSN